MKWKHKTAGWTAMTYEYGSKKEHLVPHHKVLVTMIDSEEEVYIPTKLILADPNWEEIPDERWLDHFRFTVREFMEAFAMTISESASSHDSVVAKGMVDKILDRIHHETWKVYNQNKELIDELYDKKVK